MLILIRKASPDFRNTKLLLSLALQHDRRSLERQVGWKSEPNLRVGGGGGEDWGLEGRRKGSHFVPTCFARQLMSNDFAAGVEAFLREPGHCVSKV